MLSTSKHDEDTYKAILLVSTNGLELQNVNDNLKNNYKVVIEAVANNPNAIQYASSTLKNDFNLNYIQQRRFGWSLMYYVSKSEPTII
jgi:hypothetical protein